MFLPRRGRVHDGRRHGRNDKENDDTPICPKRWDLTRTSPMIDAAADDDRALLRWLPIGDAGRCAVPVREADVPFSNRGVKLPHG